jgi:hypothetical protein
MRYHFAASFMSFLTPLPPFEYRKPSSVDQLVHRNTSSIPLTFLGMQVA